MKIILGFCEHLERGPFGPCGNSAEVDLKERVGFSHGCVLEWRSGLWEGITCRIYKKTRIRKLIFVILGLNPGPSH